MDFSDALKCLKRGERVSRSGWNGMGMSIYLIPEGWTHSRASNSPITEIAGPNLPFVAMHTADKYVVPWLCSQTDMLADDWGVV